MPDIVLQNVTKEFTGGVQAVDGVVLTIPDEDATLCTGQEQGLLVARVDARTSATIGGTITLAVDPSRMYFFSPDTGESLLDPPVAVAAA